MVKVREDLTGRTFGKLIVLHQVEDYITPKGKHYARWLCECSCAEKNQVVVWGINLTKKNNPTNSCGCIRAERIKQTKRESKKYNDYNLLGEYGIGWTSNTRKEFYFDLEDYDKIKNYYWSEQIAPNGYGSLVAWDSNERKVIKMSYLLGFKKYDHINRNPLDNRKENFREANQKENARNRSIPKNNTSGIIGVHWCTKTEKWIAQIRVNNSLIYLGSFKNKEDAIVVRLKAELKYWGVEFAPQRHLFEEYGIDNNMED